MLCYSQRGQVLCDFHVLSQTGLLEELPSSAPPLEFWELSDLTKPLMALQEGQEGGHQKQDFTCSGAVTYLIQSGEEAEE